MDRYICDRSAVSYADDDTRVRYNKRGAKFNTTHIPEIYDALRLAIPFQSLQDATNIYHIMT